MNKKNKIKELERFIKIKDLPFHVQTEMRNYGSGILSVDFRANIGKEYVFGHSITNALEKLYDELVRIGEIKNETNS